MELTDDGGMKSEVRCTKLEIRNEQACSNLNEYSSFVMLCYFISYVLFDNYQTTVEVLTSNLFL
jgi:hypothetical protein